MVVAVIETAKEYHPVTCIPLSYHNSKALDSLTTMPILKQ
jgi:hypothetical protein